MMMKRGEVWTISGGDYAGKPQPAVVIQDDAFQTLDSVTTCPLTTDFRGTGIVRVLVEPNDRNGLQRPSRLMADKITTLSRAKIGKHIGTLDPEDMQRLDRAVMIFLGLG